MLSALVGVTLKFLVDYLVGTEWFSWVTPGQKNRILALAALVSGAVGVVTAVASGVPAEGSLQFLSEAVVNTFTAFAATQATHQTVKALDRAEEDQQSF